ncbi:nuclear transport factor 2 family protein [Rhizobium sp. YS-1r]|uniref:Nuclear transport factor 2 family protein n=1 Tax=Neorhizobium phenanthreniclasticum TaxID=3157917 RepID=A0ABV0LZE4_9HYPH|nr:nuclear transport factor 2 family protein [Rhizobium sp. YS-1r]KGE01265.1 hypothetical protein JL39_09025 [Rhizobium sp. YS-1r]
MWELVKVAIFATFIAIIAPQVLLAQECPTQDEKIWAEFSGVGSSYRPVTIEERNAVMDTLARYAWAMDNRDSAMLAQVFTEDAEYYLCGLDSDSAQERAALLKGISSHFGSVFARLDVGHALARRSFTNALMGKKADGDIDVIVSVVVFIQSLNISSPQVDYTANLIATLRQIQGIWKIRILKVITDDTGIRIRAR